MCICRKQNKRKCYRKTQLKTDDIFAGPLKQSWDKLRQAVLAWLSVSELFVRLLEHPSINKASLIYPRIICTKITCISILYFTIKPDDFYFLETHRAQKECFLKVFGDVFFFFFYINCPMLLLLYNNKESKKDYWLDLLHFNNVSSDPALTLTGPKWNRAEDWSINIHNSE